MRRSLSYRILACTLMTAGACSPGEASSPPTAREVPAPAEPGPGVEPSRVEAENPSTPPAAAPAVDLERRGPCVFKAAGLAGECMATAACASLGGHMSTPGYCPGPATIACCTIEPVVDEHPRPPPGWTPVPQNRVTAQMTAWALMVVSSPGAYPMGAKTTERFGPVEVMARVEWHPADLGHGVVHRGVTLYQPG